MQLMTEQSNASLSIRLTKSVCGHMAVKRGCVALRATFLHVRETMCAGGNRFIRTMFVTNLEEKRKIQEITGYTRADSEKNEKKGNRRYRKSRILSRI